MDQITRIKEKLVRAKLADKKLEVFGASSHEYFMNEPCLEAEVIEFEKSHRISLPDGYKSFLTEIGNGGKSYRNSAAGPYYGIYPLGEEIDELCEGAENHLRSPCLLEPNMSDEDWNALTAELERDDISDDDWEAEYSGILPIGSQGCTYLHALILNGPYRGKIVYFDIDTSNHHFTFEDNFLDWYERWLDEVIAGDLLSDSPTWFGNCRGGTADELYNLFTTTDNSKVKLECLDSLLNKAEVPDNIINSLEQQIKDSSIQQQEGIIQLLVKRNYQLSKPYLINLFTTNPLKVFQYLNWYGKEHADDWTQSIKSLLNQNIKCAELFRFCTYIARECSEDLSSFVLSYLESPDNDIKSQAEFALGEIKAKHEKVTFKSFTQTIKDWFS